MSPETLRALNFKLQILASHPQSKEPLFQTCGRQIKQQCHVHNTHRTERRSSPTSMFSTIYRHDVCEPHGHQGGQHRASRLDSHAVRMSEVEHGNTRNTILSSLIPTHATTESTLTNHGFSSFASSNSFYLPNCQICHPCLAAHPQDADESEDPGRCGSWA